MAFATDAQRRWFFAHLATGMRRIAGKMAIAERNREVEKYWQGSISGSAPVDAKGNIIEGRLAVTGTDTPTKDVIRRIQVAKTATGASVTGPGSLASGQLLFKGRIRKPSTAMPFGYSMVPRPGRLSRREQGIKNLRSRRAK